MKKKILVAVAFIFFLLALWFVISILNNLDKSATMPDTYTITFGYNINDSNLSFIDSAEEFTTRENLKAQISFPSVHLKSSKGVFKVINVSSGKVVQTFNMNINKGVSGQMFNLDAIDWPLGTYECTFEIDGKILSKNNFVLK
ncbi:hypothetical protein GCM10010912_64620 [Paenibacillus albidus]|uniref:Uncharacterized protein n=1 Tax=Paenibacillus albidus TaxID=2041023 RepID=A0A917FWE4_9BACL|nr:hypothetical protein [Paenibacillus albidus]GGG11287.1 hypothetical protein GCM10010912_64620 [Paenibacillus albidus]